MKKVFSLFGLCLCASVALSLAAEEAKPAEAAPSEAQKMVDRRLKLMAERLNLTPEQSEKIGTILLRDQERFIALRDDPSLSPQSRNAKARAILQASTVELQAILTADQKKLWAEEAERQRKALLERQAERKAAQAAEKKAQEKAPETP